LCSFANKKVLTCEYNNVDYCWFIWQIHDGHHSAVHVHFKWFMWHFVISIFYGKNELYIATFTTLYKSKHTLCGFEMPSCRSYQLPKNQTSMPKNLFLHINTNITRPLYSHWTINIGLSYTSHTLLSLMDENGLPTSCMMHLYPISTHSNCEWVLCTIKNLILLHIWFEDFLLVNYANLEKHHI